MKLVIYKYSETGNGTMVHGKAFNSMSPTYGTKIPNQVRDTLAAAGLMTSAGLLVINTLKGLVPIGDNWVQYWDQLPEDVRKSFETSGFKAGEV